MKSTAHFDIRITQTQDVAMATIEAPGFEDLVGVSKRHPTDKPDTAVGQLLALERLFAQLADHYREVRRVLTQGNAAAENLVGDSPEDDFWALFEVPDEELA